MKKNWMVAILLFLSFGVMAQEQDSVYIEGFKIQPGEQKEVSIKLAVPSGKQYMQIQCNVFLPSGLSFVKAYGGRTKTYTKLDEYRCEGMNFLVSDIATIGDYSGSLAVVLAGN